MSAGLRWTPSPGRRCARSWGVGPDAGPDGGGGVPGDEGRGAGGGAEPTRCSPRCCERRLNGGADAPSDPLVDGLPSGRPGGLEKDSSTIPPAATLASIIEARPASSREFGSIVRRPRSTGVSGPARSMGIGSPLVSAASAAAAVRRPCRPRPSTAV